MLSTTKKPWFTSTKFPFSSFSTDADSVPWKPHYTINKEAQKVQREGREAASTAHSHVLEKPICPETQLQLILKNGLPVGDSSWEIQFHKSHQEPFMDLNNPQSCKLHSFSFVRLQN